MGHKDVGSVCCVCTDTYRKHNDPYGWIGAVRAQWPNTLALFGENPGFILVRYYSIIV